jgi:hypothetical protein
VTSGLTHTPYLPTASQSAFQVTSPPEASSSVIPNTSPQEPRASNIVTSHPPASHFLGGESVAMVTVPPNVTPEAESKLSPHSDVTPPAEGQGCERSPRGGSQQEGQGQGQVQTQGRSPPDAMTDSAPIASTLPSSSSSSFSAFLPPPSYPHCSAPTTNGLQPTFSAAAAGMTSQHRMMTTDAYCVTSYQGLMTPSQPTPHHYFSSLPGPRATPVTAEADLNIDRILERLSSGDSHAAINRSTS